MHFLSINANGRGGAGAQANPVALNSGPDDPDLPVNHDLFADTPTEH
jgi:hypothetical protein